MLLLVLDVTDYVCQLRVRIGESPEPFLPGETTDHPPVLVDVIGGGRFDVPYQIRKGNAGFETDQNVRVIGHAMNQGRSDQPRWGLP
jgi:hypothetical protein